MAGVLQSTLLADEDQSLSLGEPHLESHQGATLGGMVLCPFARLVEEQKSLAMRWLGRAALGQHIVANDAGQSLGLGDAAACQEINTGCHPLPITKAWVTVEVVGGG